MHMNQKIHRKSSAYDRALEIGGVFGKKEGNESNFADRKTDSEAIGP